MKHIIARKLTNALLLAALLAGSMSIINTQHVSAKSCPIGYSQSWATGKCVKIKITGNNTLSRNFKCLTSIPNWTPAKYNKCMGK